MLKELQIFVLIAILSTCVFAQPENNVGVVKILEPEMQTGYFRTASNNDIKVRFQNTGKQVQNNVETVVQVTRQSGKVVYRDTLILNSLLPGEVRDTTFKDFYSTARGWLLMCVSIISPTDEVPSDNSLCDSVRAAYLSDVVGVGVNYPDSGQRISVGTEFKPKGSFINDGKPDLYNIPVRAQIRNRKDLGTLLFQSDTVISHLILDESPTSIIFPSRSGTSKTGSLPPGHYRISLHALERTDANRTNDTSYQYFTVVDSTILDNIVASRVGGPTYDPSTGLSEVTAYYYNNGVNDLINVSFATTITDQSKNVVYRDTLKLDTFFCYSEFKAQFRDFFSRYSVGINDVSSVVMASQDQDPSDDTARTTFFRGLVGDIKMVSLTSPTPDRPILSGSPLRPSGILRWIGGYEYPQKVYLRADFYSCGVESPLPFYGDTTIIHGEGIRDSFAFSFPSYPTQVLTDTCYKICVYHQYWQDTYPINDTVCTTFSIVSAGTVVKNDLVLDLAVYPNPTSHFAILHGQTSQPGQLIIHVFDLSGHKILTATEQCLSGPIFKVLDLTPLQSGAYHCKLSYSTTDGKVKEQLKTISVVK